MNAETTVRAKVSKDVKDKATEALEKMGLSLSDAIRIYLIRIAGEGRVPFEIRIPNQTTLAAIEELANDECITVTNMDDYRSLVYGDDS